MAIGTYSELQAAVASWLHRTDLTDRVPEFIVLAETRLNGDVKARPMETRTTLTCTASSRFVTLPTDMLDMRRLTLMSDPADPLEYKSPDQLIDDSRFLESTGRPANFSIVGAQIELAPTPDDDYELELLYRQRIPALSNSNTTNWLLTANPNVYLYGSLLAAAPWTQDEARMPVYERLYREGIDSLNKVDWYSGSTLRVRAR